MKLTIACVTIAAVLVTERTVRADATSNQVIQIRPIRLGTSGGNLKDRDPRGSLNCCSGTLGALVTDGVDFYILGNNHAMAQSNKGKRGQIITQPGLTDADCVLGAGNAVANLTTFVRLRTGPRKNKVDAAIAKITSSNDVDVSGAILDIGQPSSEILVPTLGSTVRKSGRTTGLTIGTVTAINGSLTVAGQRCLSTKSKRQRFENQIIITPSNFGSFADHGDSGALVVEDADECPRPVGLLFAGATTAVAANPIGEVLSELGTRLRGTLQIVGCAPQVPDSAPSLAAAAQLHGVAAHSFRSATAGKEQHQEKLFSLPGVVGVAIGQQSTDASQACLTILVEEDSAEVRQSVADALDGAEHNILVTGTFTAR